MTTKAPKIPARYVNKLASSIKNPRKLKKSWKKKLIFEHYGWIGQPRSRGGLGGRLHWVPGAGWTATLDPHVARRHALQAEREGMWDAHSGGRKKS